MTEDTTIGDQVRLAREAKGWSQSELAEKIGANQQTIGKIETGKIKRSSYLGLIERALGIDLHKKDTQALSEFQIARKELSYGPDDLPVRGLAEGGDGALVISPDPFDFVARPEALSRVPDAYAVIVVGESMIPEFKPGETALIHPHLPPVPGEPHLFISDDGNGTQTACIKSLIRATPEIWHVESWNPHTTGALERKLWQTCHRIIGKYTRR